MVKLLVLPINMNMIFEGESKTGTGFVGSTSLASLMNDMMGSMVGGGDSGTDIPEIYTLLTKCWW